MQVHNSLDEIVLIGNDVGISSVWVRFQCSEGGPATHS